MGKVFVFDHPLIQHKTALMRKTDTSVKEFRELAKEVATLMGFEATRNLELEDVEIETPICKTKMKMLKGEDIAIVPILRAGLGFVDGMLALVPNAKVGHIGLYRDPETHEPVEYYCKLPVDIEKRKIFVVDPMPVSYTHLDVYKRQGDSCIGSCPYGMAECMDTHNKQNFSPSAYCRSIL